MLRSQCGIKSGSSARFLSGCGAAISQSSQEARLQAASESLRKEISSQREFMHALGEIPVVDNDRAAYYKSTINADWGERT